MDPNSDSWLSKNVRPIILIMAFSTISAKMLLQIPVVEWLMKSYVGWTGTMITFYFGVREVIKYIYRRKSK